MNWETFIGIAGAFGGLEALKWLVGLRSSRRKAESETAETLENIAAKRMKTYEDSILFLQNQLQEKERQFAELSTKYQESMQRGLELTRNLGEMKLRYRQSRCDRKDCDNRKPPFSWLKQGSRQGAAVILTFLLLLATSCTRKVYVPVESVVSRTDTAFRTAVRCDTVLQKDSVWVYQNGDTLIKESWRIREKVKTERDTVYVTVKESVTQPKIVEVEKKKPKSGGLRWLAVGAALALAFVFLLRSRR